MRRFEWTIAVITATVFAFGCGPDQPLAEVPSKGRLPSQQVSDTVRLKSAEAAAQSLLAELEKAYRSSSDEELAAFFQRWCESEQPVLLDDVACPLERELYAVYLAVFRPYNLDELAGSFLQDSEETYNNTYDHVNYIILPTSLRFRVGSSEAEQTLDNFRPSVQVESAKLLFLTPRYEKALEAFLDRSSSPGTIGSLDDAYVHAAETVRRLEFVNRQVRITLGHWEGWDSTPRCNGCVQQPGSCIRTAALPVLRPQTQKQQRRRSA